MRVSINERKISLESLVAHAASKPALYAFTLGVPLQSLHVVEHIAQLYQHALLGLSVADSHGLIFFLDFEWNHWVFNTLYLVLLGIVFYGCQLYKTRAWPSQNRLACVAFVAGFAVQGYHFIEHSVRIVQFLQRGCTPCPGILGSFFDGVYLHFALNATVYILPLIAFIVFGFPQRILGKLDRSN